MPNTPGSADDKVTTMVKAYKRAGECSDSNCAPALSLVASLFNVMAMVSVALVTALVF